jgi:hypothetical protein
MSQRSSVIVAAPVADLACNPSDRRAHPRIISAKLPLTNARIASVGPGSVVDLSAGGALIDLPNHVRPEARLALQLETAVERMELPFQLLRCYVAAIDSGGPTYRVAGTFDRPLDVEALTVRASGAVQRLIATLDRLRGGLQKSAEHSRSDAAFSEILGGVAAWLRRGDSIDLVALKVKAQLTYQYPSLKILTLVPSANDLTAVGGFGVTLKSRHQLSSYDRRFLRAHTQLLAQLEDARRAVKDEVDPSPRQRPEVILGAGQWMTTSQASAGLTN